MGIEIFFNELSSLPIADTTNAARSRMAAFARTLGDAITAGCKPTLRTTSDFAQIALAPNYNFYNWRNDSAAERDHRVLINSLALKSPHLVGIPGHLMEIFLGCDGFHEKRRAVGLTAALVCDGLAASFQSAPDWNSANLVLTVNDLIDEGEIIARERSVRHANSPAHVQEHRPWLVEMKLGQIQDGAKLWKLRTDVLSHLDFCDGVGDAIASMSANHVCVSVLIKRLLNLEQVAAGWRAGEFQYDGLQGGPRPESAKTMEKFASDRKFRCHDGISREFSWHLTLPEGWRLYFLPDAIRFRIHVGYVGTHLPTVKFPK